MTFVSAVVRTPFTLLFPTGYGTIPYTILYNTNGNFNSSTCAKKPSKKRKGSKSPPKMPASKKRKKNDKVPTEKHIELRRIVESVSKWEAELESIHGFSNGECCEILAVVAQHINNDKFPPVNGNRFVQHAKEGWEHMKEHNRLMKLYPDCLDQTMANGRWKML
eukprot:scaffold2510_cov169-Amphora_coffeaeformis.AAC.9